MYNILNDPDTLTIIGMHIPYLEKLLSESSCTLITQLKVDYNYIEVTPYGTCFNIKEKMFEENPALKGSPRAFSFYEYKGDVPYPEIFVEGKLIYSYYIQYTRVVNMRLDPD